jgi:hypothetical protein
MVELLLRHGMDATVALERWSDEIVINEQVSLLCGYRIDPLERQSQAVLRRVMPCHSHLLPPEDPVRFDQAVDRAYAEVFGVGADVELLRDLMVTGLSLRTTMSESQAALFALDDMPPLIAEDVRARALRHYSRVL